MKVIWLITKTRMCMRNYYEELYEELLRIIDIFNYC